MSCECVFMPISIEYGVSEGGKGGKLVAEPSEMRAYFSQYGVPNMPNFPIQV
jgi:hypothetical protein